MKYLGDFPTNGVVYFAFTTHDKDDSSPIAPSSAFEAADLVIYRNDSATQRSSASGITMTSPFDSVTGLHMVKIDLSDNTDAGFWSAGYEYIVVLDPDETVDLIDPMCVLCQFSIERAGGALANILLMMHKDSNKSFNQASDSLEAIRDRGDAAWLTGASGAADVSYVHDSGSTGIVIGDVDGGTIANIDVADGTTWDIGEVAGTITYPETAGGQGIRVEITFAAGVGELPVSLNVWAGYNGGASHQINVYMYDYVGAGWELIGTIPNNGGVITPYSFPTHVTHIKADGEMKVMFHHNDGTGIATHVLKIDKVEVENQTPGPSTAGDVIR